MSSFLSLLPSDGGFNGRRHGGMGGSGLDLGLTQNPQYFIPRGSVLRPFTHHPTQELGYPNGHVFSCAANIRTLLIEVNLLPIKKTAGVIDLIEQRMLQRENLIKDESD